MYLPACLLTYLPNYLPTYLLTYLFMHNARHLLIFVVQVSCDCLNYFRDDSTFNI